MNRRLTFALRLAVPAFFLSAPLFAQGNVGNIRVARLSRAEGQVLVSHPESATWDDAPVNLPLEEGDSLATVNGIAEIEFDNGATASLGANSVLRLTQLQYASAGLVTDLSLSQGTGIFNTSVADQDTYQVETLTFNVRVAHSAEFRIDGFVDGAAVQVFSGDVSVSTTKGTTNLDKGQSVAVRQKDFQDLSVGSLPTAEDAFDRWATEQGEMIRAGNKNTLTYLNSPNFYGLSDLSRYGSWVNVAGFGNSWRPFSVGFTWTPFMNGKWMWNSNLGWIWVSSEPWGWMPYHFGGWVPSPTLGWIWVPGGTEGLKQWQPARVNWVNVGNRVAWVAKSPEDREGAPPANAAKSVIVRGNSSDGKGESNQVISGKDVRDVTLLHATPGESAFRVQPGAPKSPIEIANRAPTKPIEPLSPAPIMPQPVGRGTVPRLTQPAAVAGFIRTRPAYLDTPVASKAAPASGVMPSRSLAGAPSRVPPMRPVVPPQVPGAPAMANHGAANPIAPHPSNVPGPPGPRTGFGLPSVPAQPSLPRTEPVGRPPAPRPNPGTVSVAPHPSVPSEPHAAASGSNPAAPQGSHSTAPPTPHPVAPQTPASSH